MLAPLAGVALLASAAAALTLPPIPADLSTPVQQRLAFNGPFAMNVGWNTYQQLSKPKVHYGLLPGLLLQSASSSDSETYPTSRTWANSVTLTNLLPGTTYYYKIDSTNSTVGSFKTARIAGDMTPYTVALVADMGVFGPDGLSTRAEGYTGKAITDPLAMGAHTTIEDLVATKDSYEFIVHPGDFAYADAWAKEIKAGTINGSSSDPAGDIYEGLNEQFWDQYARITQSKPLMVSVGNHEANCDNSKGGFCPVGQMNFTGYVNRFQHTLPEEPKTIFGRRAAARAAAAVDNDPLAPFWYSYDYGMVHYVHYNTETDLALTNGTELTGNEVGQFGKMAQQIEWLEKDLAKVNRLKTPWIVAAGHRPWYVNGGGDTVSQSAFEPLFIKYGVDLVVAGHVHNMQRQAPIANNVIDPNGLNNPAAPMYIVNGAAGHWEGLDDVGTPLDPYVVFSAREYGYSTLSFKDRNHLEIKFIASDDGSVLDTSVLYKKH